MLRLRFSPLKLRALFYRSLLCVRLMGRNQRLTWLGRFFRLLGWGQLSYRSLLNWS